jgi:hypothetical protein
VLTGTAARPAFEQPGAPHPGNDRVVGQAALLTLLRDAGVTVTGRWSLADMDPETTRWAPAQLAWQGLISR